MNLEIYLFWLNFEFQDFSNWLTFNMDNILTYCVPQGN